MTLPKIEAFPSREALFDAAASVLASALTDGVAKRGQAGFAATGGTTPAPVYDRLATMTVPWDKVVVTLTDDRFVPPSHMAGTPPANWAVAPTSRAASLIIAGYSSSGWWADSMSL